MSAPLFSVVIACRNPGSRLRSALESVWQQTGAEAEAVVVDGASTDGTREWLETQRNRLGALLSEPDTGVYDAMNKGAKLARGRWLLFLGADDRLAGPDVLARVAGAARTAQTELLCGEAAYTDGRIWRAPVSPNVRSRNFLHHQACFHHRSIFERHAFDATLPVQADYELNLRLWCAGVRPVPLAVRVSLCGTGGLSDGGRWANYRDEIRARHRHFSAGQCWGWDGLSVARYLRKKIVRTFSPHG